MKQREGLIWTLLDTFKQNQIIRFLVKKITCRDSECNKKCGIIDYPCKRRISEVTYK